MDVGRARVSRHTDGSVLFDDPRAPLVVRVWTATPDGPNGRRAITRLRVDVRDPEGTVTARQLAHLPVAQMLHVAATTATFAEVTHPNEVYYALLAQPKPLGQRSWGDDHWGRVLEVHQWAKDTGRPGGGVKAVADLWGRSVHTAEHWVTEAHHRQQVG